MSEKNKDIDHFGLPTEDVDLWVIAVERTREDRKEFAAEKKSILWAAWDFTKRIDGHPEQIGAITCTHCCDRCQCFPLSDCTWFVCGGVSQRMNTQRGSHWFLREMRATSTIGEKEVFVLEAWHRAELCGTTAKRFYFASRTAGTSGRSPTFLHFLKTDCKYDRRRPAVRSAKKDGRGFFAKDMALICRSEMRVKAAFR